MGKVALKLKIMPSEAGVDLEEMAKQAEQQLPEYAQLVKHEIVPIAFGLKALMLTIVMPDQSPDEMVEKIEKIEGVESVNIEDVSLI
ncbi:elongation factor 1-beta [Thermoplasmatales archaeon ex4484_30]|nr:MAG: elongation factor 1-beta [Thermoplasmata archaeon]OYT59910.1 MAG: elongation factor 1-beta [Thermoplasmatales archaeon ex4484_30]